MTEIQLSREPSHFIGRFTAMASPCDVLVETESAPLAYQLVETAAECAWRIEKKFSRYRDDSVVQRINFSHGEPVTLDDETANLLDFAATLTTLSEGRFDITSGVLRKAWTFDGGEDVPDKVQIDRLLPLIGWHKATWQRPRLRLPAGMQIDFGGIGKEYAVDSAAEAIHKLEPNVSCVVNFGGDVAVKVPRRDGEPWRIGIESTMQSGTAVTVIPLTRGALATSGDSRRFVQKDGVRYSHILDARTGWPVSNAPRSITVVAGTCTEAGTLTTLAMLQGSDAEDFLQEANARFWVQR